MRVFRGRNSAGWAALMGVAVAATGCESGYSLAPTFCDDWCHATLLPACDESPSNCVSTCELTKASSDCFPLQETLLECYEDATHSALICGGPEFRPETRVKDGVCQAERDALFECEAPGISACLSLCRQTQEEQLANVVEPTAHSGMPVQAPRLDGGTDNACPVLDQPCEELCWTVFAFSSAGLLAAGVEPTPSRQGQEQTPPNDTESAGISTECLEQALLGCYVDLPAAPEQSNADDGASGAAAPSIGSVLDDCSELTVSN